MRCKLEGQGLFNDVVQPGHRAARLRTSNTHLERPDSFASSRWLVIDEIANQQIELSSILQGQRFAAFGRHRYGIAECV